MADSAGEVIEIGSRHRLLVCQPWEISAVGMTSPVSYSLHTSLAHAYAYIQSVNRERANKPLPAAYARVSAAPHPAILNLQKYEEVAETSVPVNGSNFYSPSQLVVPIDEWSEVPNDCRNEAGEFPPAFASDPLAISWTGMFRAFSFRGQQMLVDAFDMTLVPSQ